MRQVQPETLPKNSNLPVYKISSLKITPPKTPNSGQFSYPLPNIVSFLFRLEFRFRSRDFSFNLFPVWQSYCWRFWSAIVVHIHTSTINAPELRERNSLCNTWVTLCLLHWIPRYRSRYCFTNLMLPMLTYPTDYYFPSNMFIIVLVTCRGWVL